MTRNSHPLSEIIAKIKAARIAVIGDLMIDEYITGEVSRISPEAPVPVVRSLTQRQVPGGAANVAANVAAMGANAFLVGVVGDDGGDMTLVDALARYEGESVHRLVRDPNRRTTRKLRILAQHQQIVRLDAEDNHPLEASTRAELIDAGRVAIASSDVVVFSDYGKGTLDEEVLAALIGLARGQGKFVLVDPKRRDFSAYRGASLLKPNRTELIQATGLPLETEEQLEVAAAAARAMFGGDLLLTRSEKGMSYFGGDADSIHIPTVAREVFDVSGAGDTVVAALACAVAAGAAPVDAIRIANHAAGVVVGKVGTATLTSRELRDAVSAAETADGHPGQLATWEEAVRLRARWHAEGFTVGVANGCFDIIHPGHTSLIRQAASSCDRLIMALNSDDSVRRLKGPTRPVQSEGARAQVIGAMRGVDLVVLFDQDTPLELIEALQPDILVKGADYTIDNVVGADIVIARGGSVILADLTEGQSTTSLLARVR